MKNKRMLQHIGDADDRFVEEAADSIEKQKTPWLRILALACSLVFVVGLGLYLFLPYGDGQPNLSPYRKSDYYGLIEKISAYTYTPPQYDNNFDAWLDNMVPPGGATAPGDAPPTIGEAPGSAEGNGQYEEITDNQVTGVVEGDRIKRSDRHIYYLAGKFLRVYEIGGEATVEIDTYSLPAYVSDMYLSGDCRTLTLLVPGYRETTVLSLDVNEPADVKEKGRITVTGSYSTSRMVDGTLLLLTKYTLPYGTPDYDDPTNFAPYVTSEDGEKTALSADKIWAPDKLTNLTYTVAVKLDEDSLEKRGESAYLSYSDIYYISKTTLYMTRRYEGTEVRPNGYPVIGPTTEILAVDYSGDEMKKTGSMSVSGYLQDQYSMDEYEGVLRVVTTTRETVYTPDEPDYPAPGSGDTGANLYCLDMGAGTVLGQVYNFAPWGETVQSVRFDGTQAYVCTAEVVVLTDPVFFFDLSDPQNITYTDTGDIKGYSFSLVNFAPGYLLGIGVGDVWDEFKLEMYREEGGQVVSVAVYEVPAADYATDYKAYYIDRENGLIGFGIYQYDKYNNDQKNYPNRYVLLKWQDGVFTELVNCPLNGAPNNKRGCYIDGYFYMFGEGEFAVRAVEIG